MPETLATSRAGGKSIAIRRERVRRLQDEEISTFVDWKAGQHALQHIEEAVTGEFGFPN